LLSVQKVLIFYDFGMMGRIKTSIREQLKHSLALPKKMLNGLA